MKKLLVFLLLAQVWALTMTKTVTGPELIDVNETIGIRIEISAENEYVERLEDDIPEHFVATGLPSSCQQTEQKLICNFGQSVQGALIVNYGLLAIGTGSGIIDTPQLYYAGGLKTIEFSYLYFIGRPKIVMSVDGEAMLLPESDIDISVTLENPGAKVVSDAILKIQYPGKNITFDFELSPGEMITKWFMIGQAGHQGYVDIVAKVDWDNESVSDRLSIIFISPSVSVRRDVDVKWQADSEGLAKYILVTYKVLNNGTAPGNVSFQSGDEFVITPGETRVLTKTYGETAPAEKVAVQDYRGYSYGVISFEEKTPEANKGFIVLIYEYVASEFSPWLILGALVGSVYFSTKFKNPNIKAGFLVLTIVSALLLYSSYSVGAVKIPEFAPKS